MKKAFYNAKSLAWVLILALLVSVLPTAALAVGGKYDTADAVSFVFSNSGITTADTTHTSSYKIEGTALTIKGAGTYILSGSCSDGSVTVKKGMTDVTLVLNGLSLTNTGSATSATAPLSCNKSTGVTIVIAAGTTNTLKDSVYNNDEAYTTNEDAENAVIKCKDGAQVTITGSGTLNVISNGKNGIKSGTTDTETDADNPRDASLTIENATLNITANVNDAINAEQKLKILSGTLNIAAADDALHSDYYLTIGTVGAADPIINITKSNEGIEGATVAIYSGNISILSTDDCINAANSDLTNYNFSLTISGGTLYAYTTTGDGFDSNGSLNISGGTVEVWGANTADNQPLDADGTINISGGTVFAAGGSNGMGSKLNATQTCITFGNSESRQMGNRQQMSNQQRQQSSQNTAITAGTSVSVKNSSNTVLYTATAPCNSSYVLFSSPALNSSDTYSLAAGNSAFDNTLSDTRSNSSDGIRGNSPTENTSPDFAVDDNTDVKTSGRDSFKDVKNTDWYYNAVQYAYEHQLMIGTSADSFSPEMHTTRQQIWMILARVSGNSPSNMTEARAWAMDNGLTDGTNPSNVMTREQLAATLYRYADYSGYDISGKSSLTSFSDANNVSSYARDALSWAVNAGIISGAGNNTLIPTGTATRAQLATILMRFCQKYSSESACSKDTYSDSKTYVSTGADENAILIEEGSVELSDITVTRSSANSTGGDNASFYGVGAAILVKGGTATIDNATITTDSAGGAGVFAYGDGVVKLSNSNITTKQNTSGGIHVAGGGTLYATDVVAETSGQSSAAIRSDRGGGLIVADGGSYTSNGIGSPAVYCTANITVKDAELEATGSEAVCIEGLNSLYLYDCDLTGNMSDDKQNDCTWNVILYQSMSGDSQVGNSTFQMDGGTLTAKNGGMFYTTNTESTFVLKDVDLVCTDSDEFLLKCTGNSNQRGWGSSGANGADCTFTAIDQSMDGNVIWDSISNLKLYLTSGSTLTGGILQDESCAGNGGSGTATLCISSDSVWTVTENSVLTSLYNAGKVVDTFGNTVTIKNTNGIILVKGSSKLTVTVSDYNTTVDLSGAGSVTSYENAQVNTGSQITGNMGGVGSNFNANNGQQPPEIPNGSSNNSNANNSQQPPEIPSGRKNSGSSDNFSSFSSFGRGRR